MLSIKLPGVEAALGLAPNLPALLPTLDATLVGNLARRVA